MNFARRRVMHNAKPSAIKLAACPSHRPRLPSRVTQRRPGRNATTNNGGQHLATYLAQTHTHYEHNPLAFRIDIMLGRQVGTSLLRLPRCARLPIRSLQQHDLAARPLAPSLHRFYADLAVRRPSRPKKAVGEPSRPVKRDVKRAAKSPKEDAATQKVKARKATAKKKVASPKKKELTEEQKARQASRAAKRKERLQKADIAELKKLALDAPRLRITNPWLQFIQEKLNLKEHMTSGQRVTESFSQRQKEIIQEYRNITPAEQEVNTLSTILLSPVESYSANRV